MTRTSFLLPLLTVAAVASGALAQVQSAPPPTHYTLDARGVDLITGSYNHTATEVVIGNPGQGGLSYSRTWGAAGWRSNLMGVIAVSGSTYTVSFGGVSDQFLLTLGVYAPVIDRGQTLTKSGSVFTYTAGDGTVATFEPTGANYFEGQAIQNGGVVRTVTYPSGEVVTYTYNTGAVIIPPEPPELPHPRARRGTRLQSVSNNLGYQLKLAYALDEPMWPEDIDAYLTLVQVTGFNMAVDACAPSANGCAFSRTWPSATYAANGNQVTDELARTTVYSSSLGKLTGIRRPTTPSGNDIAIAYASNRVSAVTIGADTWTYAYADASGNRTTTVTDPLTHTNVVVSNLATGRAASSTDGLGHTTTFLWDAQGRPTRTTLPEGNYTAWTYGVRGNVTQVTNAEKPVSGQPDLPDIVTSATYPASCTNRRTCNKPVTTTDERGNVTDYTWDAAHGGLLTVTLPEPTPGADRPQTRLSYSSLYAWYKNTAGTIVQAPAPVWRPTGVSQCAIGETCAGTAAEVKTTVVYGVSGVANNLLPTASTSGDGTGALAATTTMTWTPNGDVETVDGPLAGSADTTRYRYDAGRQLIGVIGPDPDGGGGLLHRAVRNSYNADGQVTQTAHGTVTSQSDPAWNAFSPLQLVDTAYDDIGRPVRTALGAAGSVHSVQQVSYDAAHRVECSAVRMNPATFGTLPASACTAATTGGFGPDRIARNAYDAADQLTGVTTADGLPEAITETATYTGNGLPASLTDGRGNVSIPVYDRFDRLSRLRYPNATGGGASTTDYEEYAYDAASNVTGFRNRSNQNFTAGFDALNRQVSYTPPDFDQRSIAYDNLGRPLSLVTMGSYVWNLQWTWDALSRQLTEQQGLGTLTSQYDLAGRRTRLTWPDGYYAAYEYDLYGGLTAVHENGAASGPGVLATYAYDDRGMRTGMARGDGVSTAWGYDAVSRLTSLSHNPSGTGQDLTLGFSYNPAGQIVGRTVSNDAYVYAPTVATTASANDGLNRVTNVGGTTVAYDTRGNITSGLGKAFGYDSENSLTSADSATFRFDPLGRLERSTGVATNRFLYDGLQAVGEYNAADSTVTARYVPGAGLDEVVTSYAGAATTNRTWLLADERGSVIGLADGAGAATINRYDEYGAPAVGNTGRFQYTGQMWLPEAGVYHYRARAYAPGIGRFLQPDPIGYAAGANLYTYVLADPINFVDPFGELQWIRTCTPRWVLVEPGHVNSGNWVTECTYRNFSNEPYERFPGGWARGREGGWTPEQRAFERVRREEIRENAWMVAVAVAPVAVPVAAELGTTAAVSTTVRLFSRACKCFVAGTPIHTSDGPRRIEDIQLGDLVLARDEVTGETGYSAVTALISGEEKAIWEVLIETIDADGNARRETISTTSDHPWRLVGGTWAETAELYPGAELVTADGRRVSVVSVNATDRVERTYNFTVDGLHTYFVGEAAIWVHNACKPLKGPIPNFRRMLAQSGRTPRWMNQWLRQGRAPPGHEVDHIIARSVGGGNSSANLRLRTTADHVNRHRFYRPWEN